MAETDPPLVFISYSRHDDGWRRRLVRHLEVLERDGTLRIWDDQELRTGDAWADEIDEVLAEARVAILLVSANSLASAFISDIEMPQLLARRDREGIWLLPILIGPCAWRSVSWLAAIQIWSREGQPISASEDEYQIDEAMAAIATEVAELLRHDAPKLPEDTTAQRPRPRLHPPPLGLPSRPYPLLEPYRHPALLTGREQDVKDALEDLARQGLILCLHAASGTGKSSFLQAGLIPALRRAGHPTALIRRPDEPGIARRLLLELAEFPADIKVPDDDPQGFAALLAELEANSASQPILVLDQFEDTIRRDEEGVSLSRIGPLFAATAAHPTPSSSGFVARWVLTYRQEYHGAMAHWLTDVLRDARNLGNPGLEGLPADLKRPDYYRERSLGVFGEPGPSADPLAASTRIFLRAIEAPLQHTDPNGGPRYPWRFEDGDAKRLATAFAAARLRRPRAPLTPEIQVVLAYLLNLAEPSSDGSRVINVGKNPDDLVRNALGAHLERKLKEAFEQDEGELARRRRTQALIALRNLADVQGQRGRGLSVKELRRRLGEDGEVILQRLETPEIRLILQEGSALDFGQDYILPHDSLAEIIVETFENEVKRRRYDLDEDLVDLRKTLAPLVELYRQNNPAGTHLDDSLITRIRNAEASLPWDDERRRWWLVCQESWLQRRQEERRRRRRRFLSQAGVVLALLGCVMLWYVYVFPEKRVAAITGASRFQRAQEAFGDLSRLPGHGGRARKALARYLADESALAGAAGETSQALLLQLKSLRLLDSEESRKKAAMLALPFHGLISGEIGDREKVEGAVLSPDLETVAFWTAKSDLHLWSLESRASVGVVPQWDFEVRGAAFGPGGQRLVIWGREALVILDLPTETLVGRPIKASGHDIHAAAFGPRGVRIVTGGWDNKARIWNIADGRQLAEIDCGSNINAVAFHPSGNTMLTAADSETALWSLSVNSESPILIDELSAWAVAFSPDGKKFLTGNREWRNPDETVRVWDAESGRRLSEYKTDSMILTAQLANDSEVTVVDRGNHGRVRLRKLKSRTKLGHEPFGGQPLADLLLDPRGEVVFASSTGVASEGNADRFWTGRIGKFLDAESGQPSPGAFEEVAVFEDPIGPALVSYPLSNSSTVWGSDGIAGGLDSVPEGYYRNPGVGFYGGVIGGIGAPFYGGGIGAAPLHGGGLGALYGGLGHSAILPRQIRTIRAFDPKGSFLVYAHGSQLARFPVFSTDLPEDVADHGVGISAVTISPDGQALVSTTVGGVVTVFDSETGALIKSLEHSEAVTAVAFNATSNLLLTATATGRARLWDAQSGLALSREMEHGTRIEFGAFSPDGSKSLTRGGSEVRLWSASGRLACALLHEPGEVTASAWTPDSSKVLTVDSGSKARLWAIDGCEMLGQPIKLAMAAGEAFQYEGIYSSLYEDLPRPETLKFSIDGRLAVFADRKWVHFLAVHEKGMTPASSQQLPAGATGHFAIVGAVSRSIKVLVQSRPSSFYVETIIGDVSGFSPLKGEPESILVDWQSRLGLKLDKSGRPAPPGEIEP